MGIGQGCSRGNLATPGAAVCGARLTVAQDRIVKIEVIADPSRLAQLELALLDK